MKKPKNLSLLRDLLILWLVWWEGSLNLNYPWWQEFTSPSRGQQEIPQVSRQLWYCSPYSSVSSSKTHRTKSVHGFPSILTLPSVSHLQSYSWKKIKFNWNKTCMILPPVYIYQQEQLWQSDCNLFGESFLSNFSEENI